MALFKNSDISKILIFAILLSNSRNTSNVKENEVKLSLAILS